MAAEQAGGSSEHDPWESVIDDAIRDILSEAGSSTKSRGRTRDPIEALMETTLASAARVTSKTSQVERLLLAQVYASALAEALAPALADALAPEIMKAFEQHVSEGQGSDVASVSRPSRSRARGARKT